MYRVYTTPALVCGSYARNTADKTVVLFTRDAGLIYAQVKSAREERSKHRYALTDFSLLNVSLVQGKTGWHITGTEPLGNSYTKLSSREARAFVRNTVRLIRRLIRGEDPHPELFTLLIQALETTYQEDDKREDVYIWREFELAHCILEKLGHIPPRKEPHTSLISLQKDVRDALVESQL